MILRVEPTALGNRIEALDLMRGFALLGIFIANMLFFHTPILYIDPYSWFSTPSDEVAYKGIAIFIQGSFYPIFAIMFGYGLNMQFEKAVDSGSPYARVLSRRLGLLLVFGLIHGLLIWAGDILLSYAAMGFMLLLFIRLRTKWLLPIAFILYALPMGGLLALLKLAEKFDPVSVDPSFVDIHQVELSISAYAHGDFMDIMAQRFHDWLQVSLMSGALLGLFMILPLFLLGAVLSKWKLFGRAGELKRWLVMGAILLIPTGIWLRSFPFQYGTSASNQFIQEAFGGVILALGYIAIFLLLAQIRLFRSIFRPVAKAGRMSLTTYITQSIVATLIFYSYGFGLYGKVDLETGTWIACGVFVIQVIFAEIWLSKFRMGPLEWIWRRGTYGKKLSD